MSGLHFCELCEVSIPERDLEGALAVDLGGKAICQACLAKALAKVPGPAGGKETREEGGKTFPTTFAFLLLLLGLFGAVWFLHSELSWGFQDLAGRQERFAGALTAYEELLRKLAPKVDETPSRELARLGEKIDEIQGRLSVMLVRLKKKSGVGTPPGTGRDTLLRDLAQRQSALERAVFDLERKLTASLGGVSKELGALRRRSFAIPPASSGTRGASVPSDLPEKLGRFVDDLENAEVSKRWTAVDELVNSGNPKVVPYLLPRLKDRDVYVRRHCAKGLGKLGDKQAAPALIDALADPEAVVRQAALKSLEKLAGRTFSFDPESNAARRKRALAVIRKWWEKHK